LLFVFGGNDVIICEDCKREMEFFLLMEVSSMNVGFLLPLLHLKNRFHPNEITRRLITNKFDYIVLEGKKATPFMTPHIDKIFLVFFVPWLLAFFVSPAA
jgi:hypothetical protein